MYGVKAMPRPSRRELLSTLTLLGLAGILGCEPANQNEKEFLATAPPGKPPENPDEKVSERRARTHTVSKQEAKIAERNKKAAEDLAKKKAKAN